MKIITKNQIILLHDQIISETGGTRGLRDEGLLESALFTPFQVFGNEELYPSILEKAARLGFGLVKNHAFLDGNKRIGAHAMLVFLALNEIETDYSQDDLINIIMGIASGQCNYADLLEWVRAHTIEGVKHCVRKEDA